MLLQETAWWLSLVFLIGDKLVVGIENALVTINSRIVGNPSLTRLWKGCPLCAHNRAAMPHFECNRLISTVGQMVSGQPRLIRTRCRMIFEQDKSRVEHLRAEQFKVI
jgi:hypothetical protein